MRADRLSVVTGGRGGSPRFLGQVGKSHRQLPNSSGCDPEDILSSRTFDEKAAQITTDRRVKYEEIVPKCLILYLNFCFYFLMIFL